MEKWSKKHLLGIKDLSRREIDIILELSASFKEISKREVKKVPALRGKTIVNIFFENSTRTRMSFELAAKRLSADVVNFQSSASSLNKGETIVDTIKTLEAYHPDIMVIRISSPAALYLLQKYTKASIVNCGDGKNEHPTQALLDMFTVKEKLGTLENLNVLIVGDVLHSRVARSNIFGFQKYGAKITVCGPTTMIPYDFENMGVDITYDFDTAIKKADVIIMLRIQNERLKSSFFPTIREYVDKFSLTEERYKLRKKNALILHPGPVNWDVEISSALKEKVHPLILEQAENGLAVRMGVLYLVGTEKRSL
ncbi:MAG: aspartate carbamoyltransferase catalytic subunit [Candidatus Omnitrophica bacterium]|nr:aspartate carbamoyltransferase catalytic subunit [Candidatus Omnitrophota bacterium]MDD5081378.1 aspartate carbamoyltransferase catalytic subunit [Candidatus Omnitrophota bacterium]MDD5441172.1 aspartate carbamoyltransferase catalytic subunit [Candidatus Omnitrophota bacterium]